jgi:hypothetical protein
MSKQSDKEIIKFLENYIEEMQKQKAWRAERVEEDLKKQDAKIEVLQDTIIKLIERKHERNN